MMNLTMLLSSLISLLLLLPACQAWLSTTLSTRLCQHATSNTRCFHRKKATPEQEQDDYLPTIASTQFRFLGKGPNALVRPGVVLIAPPQEFHHFYRQSAIFIHAMGQFDDNDDDDYMIRGVIIDHPTPFTVAEMMEHQPHIAQNPIGNNIFFRGGDRGDNQVVLLHNRKELAGSEIGTSGLYNGGWKAALDACRENKANPDDFKLFFNYCEFSEHELEELLDEVDADTGDAWMSIEFVKDNNNDASTIVLNSDWDRGDCWKRLRNVIQTMEQDKAVIRSTAVGR